MEFKQTLEGFVPDVLGVFEVRYRDTFIAEIESYPHDNNLVYKVFDAYVNRYDKKYDDLPDDEIIDINHLANWTIHQVPNQWRTPAGTQAYFVNVYEVDRCYGGPEEGGWWFDIGTVKEHFICSSHKEAKDLQHKLRIQDEVCRDIWDHDEFRFAIELDPGKDYPEEWPRYE